MPKCLSCAGELPRAARSCPACGTPAPATASTPPPPTANDPDATVAEPTAAPLDAVLEPGAVLLDRYRVVGLIGRGGMGSVYRAQDRVLGQDVALKFLTSVAGDGATGDYPAEGGLVHEVRLARQVSHPNVCRVYDIGVIGDRMFISMEYVDGEDLGSLLRRIGRVHGDKAAQIARQLCAGLHAAHLRGVLHRDLKPQNVLIDGRGEVRIADFGIAGADDTADREHHLVGTPTYMAPELFAGVPASVASDLYALGLVLYELYTGRPLFTPVSITELRSRHRRPAPLASLRVPDIDERIEQVVLRCLASDPRDRPPSALAVLAHLPGGDPLAESLASGQTPSPELVAAAGGTGRVSPRQALMAFAVVLIGMCALFQLDPDIKLIGRAALPKEPAVLAERARQWVRELGLGPDPKLPAREAYGFAVDHAHLDALARRKAGRAAFDDALRGGAMPAVHFWYRHAPAPAKLLANDVKGRVRWDDPAPVDPGSVQLQLDARGHLRALLAIPEAAGCRAEAEPVRRAEPDWSALLAAAGLAVGRLEPVAPELVPHTFADARAAWNGRDPDVRVEAAAWCGRPVAFRVFAREADTAPTAPPVPATSWRHFGRALLLLLAIGLAWDSLRRRRSDLRGAFHVGLVIFAAVLTFTLTAGDHHWSPDGFGALLLKGMTHGLALSSELALYYLALEHHVRRIWPQTMISWSRLLTGRLRDPLVAQNVLVGQVFGVAAALFAALLYLIPRWRGEGEPQPLLLHRTAIDSLSGPAHSIGLFLELGVDAIREAVKLFVALVLLKLVLKRPWIAAAASTVLWATVWDHEKSLVSWLVVAGIAATYTLVAIRYGLLALVVHSVTFALACSFPLRMGPQIWYSAPTVLALTFVVGSSIYGACAAARGNARPRRNADLHGFGEPGAGPVALRLRSPQGS